MNAIVLESFVGSEYADLPDSYEFPGRYLRHFEPLSREQALIAVIYEPRGNEGTGRMAYVGYAMLENAPVLSGRRNARGEALWRVQYADRYRDFNRVVPRYLDGQPTESWLRPIPVGRARNVATFGRAVRPLSDSDLTTILEFGLGSDLDVEAIYPQARDHLSSDVMVRERSTRLVSAVVREARFRDDVLSGYEQRCAITGFGVGTKSPSRMFGLLDAAHIRPVWAQGSDSVTNGIALTPTLHRMFDRGLFGLTYEAGEPVVVPSPRLEPHMVHSEESSSRLFLRPRQQLLLPRDRNLWPSPDALDYHMREVFLSD
jgi:putative restriction endonuclease